MWSLTIPHSTLNGFLSALRIPSSVASCPELGSTSAFKTHTPSPTLDRKCENKELPMLTTLVNSPPTDLARCPPWCLLSSSPIAVACEASELVHSLCVGILLRRSFPCYTTSFFQTPPLIVHNFHVIFSPCRNLPTLLWITPSVTGSIIMRMHMIATQANPLPSSPTAPLNITERALSRSRLQLPNNPDPELLKKLGVQCPPP